MEEAIFVEKSEVAKTVEEGDVRLSYDENVKQLLAYKPILAWILKYCAKEFAGLTIEEIQNCIEGEPEVGKAAVHSGEQKIIQKAENQKRIIGTNTEDLSSTDGLVRYDIRFNARIAGRDEDIRLFINIEAQRLDTTADYPIEKRIVYYLSRMISSQYGIVFTKSEYGKLCKVYSIWIVSEPVESNNNSIVRFRLVQENVFGNPHYDEKNYDLMSGVLVNLNSGDDTVQNKLLKLMNMLLDSKTTVEEKENLLEKEYNIPMTVKVQKEVADMCNLSDGIYYRGYDSGYGNGQVVIIDNMIKKNLSNQEISSYTDKPVDYIETRRKALKSAAVV